MKRGPGLEPWPVRELQTRSGREVAGFQAREENDRV